MAETISQVRAKLKAAEEKLAEQDKWWATQVLQYDRGDLGCRKEFLSDIGRDDLLAVVGTAFKVELIILVDDGNVVSSYPTGLVHNTSLEQAVAALPGVKGVYFSDHEQVDLEEYCEEGDLVKA